MNPHLQRTLIEWGSTPADARLGMLAVHGRGGSPASMRGISDRLAFDDIAVFAPEADSSSWYPQPFMQPLEANEPRLSQALDALDTRIAEIAARGIPAERLVLLGFSQGACLLAQYALTRPTRYAAVVLLTGGYLGPDGAGQQFAGDLAGTPALLRSVDQDAWVPASRVTETAEALRRSGAVVDARIDVGSEHGVPDSNIRDVRALLESL